jgi:hypothetical protein
VERGFGHTPYGDHFAHSCGYEVVLPDGTMIETGMARFASPAPCKEKAEVSNREDPYCGQFAAVVNVQSWQP